MKSEQTIHRLIVGALKSLITFTRKIKEKNRIKCGKVSKELCV